MYPEERQHALALLVGQRGRLSVTTAAEQFGVTTETVRRDLAVLERAGMLRRVHGGAVPVSAVALVELGLGERTGHLSEQKAKIAAAALDFVPGMDGSIILDGGTTTAALAELLPTDRRLLVVTDAVPLAARLAERAGITVHMLGGRVRGRDPVRRRRRGHSASWPTCASTSPSSAPTASPSATASPRRTRPRPSVKRAMVRAGQRVIVLADSTKLNRETLVRFAAPEDVDVLITDDGADQDTLDALDRAGVEVVVA